MMAITHVSHFFSYGNIITGDQLTRSPRQALDEMDYILAYMYFEAHPPLHLPVEAYCWGLELCTL
jgi:hypothetical protein